MPQLRTLLIDNYDSFTFNLHQALAELSGAEPVVVRNDEVEWNALCQMTFDAIVISPGPGRPDNPRDFGICEQVIREWRVPLLGVCLGHQGIGHTFGASVVHAPEPMHGRLSPIHHYGTGLFRDVDPEFEAVRYHSLTVAEPLPTCLKKIAWTDEGLIMGIEHCSLPLWGVQFHPESICTIEGKKILRNFYRLAAEYLGRQDWEPDDIKPAVRYEPAAEETTQHRVFVKKIPVAVSPAAAFRELFAGDTYSFWLDSSMKTDSSGRFSFMGGASRQDAEVVKYYAGKDKVFIERAGIIEIANENLFDWLKKVLARRQVKTPGLPFDFNCGYVGYFGYEMKADCGSKLVHYSTQPDCTLLFADRQVVFDHELDEMYLLWYGTADHSATAEEWFSHIQIRLSHIPEASHPKGEGSVSKFIPVQSRECYLENIRRCLAYIHDGESYEICLTNKFRAHTDVDPFEYFEVLRKVNPAPYSSFMRFDECSVACSSPERFLCIHQHGSVETKPIKGTAPRGRTRGEDEILCLQLSRDVKSRAENLMIVDLLRNDLGKVCEIGTVKVPRLMNVESYATVHQLVSTVTGNLRPEYTAVDCLRHAFPGGSMTGAPKLRTLEIIDDLESCARGIYSGSLGFLALNGAADLNIVIRTAVFEQGQVSIGAGGAIVALSNPESEWDELVLKTKALIHAFEVLESHKLKYMTSAFSALP